MYLATGAANSHTSPPAFRERSFRSSGLQQRAANGDCATMASCMANGGLPYHLDTSMQGDDFFDHWIFSQADHNWGAAWYVDRAAAESESIAEAHQDHAIVRVGAAAYKSYSGDWDSEAGYYVPGTAGWKRRSARLQSNQSWTYFLLAVHLTHVPVGCGIWPALWTHSHDYSRGPWPNSGELDILEYGNNLGGKVSLHVGEANQCTLAPEAVNVCAAEGFTFADLNQGSANICWDDCETAADGVCDDGGPNAAGTCEWGHDSSDCGCRSLSSAEYGVCYTDYSAAEEFLPMELGCAPMKNGMQLTGDSWNHQLPGVLAAEWTADFVKVFYIPDAQLPDDLKNDAPEPDTWDQWVISYYPFSASEAARPGTCPNPESVMGAQHLILNIGLCGDWAVRIPLLLPPPHPHTCTRTRARTRTRTCSPRRHVLASPLHSSPPLSAGGQLWRKRRGLPAGRCGNGAPVLHDAARAGEGGCRSHGQ